MILAPGAGEQAVVADAVESARQGVEQEAAEELVSGEGHDLLAVGAALAIILVAESDPGIVEADEAAVRYRNPVGVARQIGEHRFGPGERRLGIDHPALLSDGREVPQECAPFAKMREAAKESELAVIVQRAQPGEEQAAEKRAEHAHGEQEGGACGYPARPIARDAATRHDHVDVGMMGEGGSPGVKNGGDADPGAEMLGISGDGQHRIGRGLEQEVIDQRLVGEGDRGDLGREGEDDVEIADREQVGLARFEPGARGGALAPGAVPVPATVIRDAPVATVGAGFDVATERGGAAMFDRRHDLELMQAQMPGMRGAIRGPCSTEDVGDLERGAHQPQPSGGSSMGDASASRSSGLVTLRVVLVATCK